MWLAQYLFGMLIAYYLLSPRLRKFINKLILRLSGKMPPNNIQSISTDPEDTDPMLTIKPIKQTPKIETQIVNIGGKTYIAVDDDTLEKWLENPDLRKANK